MKVKFVGVKWTVGGSANERRETSEQRRAAPTEI